MVLAHHKTPWVRCDHLADVLIPSICCLVDPVTIRVAVPAVSCWGCWRNVAPCLKELGGCEHDAIEEMQPGYAKGMYAALSCDATPRGIFIILCDPLETKILR